MQAPRINLYNAIHKALRAYMGDTLHRCARIDGSDPDDVTGGLGQVRALLDVMQRHLEHERDCLHPALHAAEPNSHQLTDGDHEHHAWAMDKLRALCDQIEISPAAARDAQLEHLQRQLSVFIGENMVHMNMEETENNAVLWKHYSDAQLMDIHAAIMQRIGPEEKALTMRWMLPALTPNERAGMLLGMRQTMPPPAFAGVLEMARQLLNERDWKKLRMALDARQPLAA